jgi:hypothetical protein
MLMKILEIEKQTIPKLNSFTKINKEKEGMIFVKEKLKEVVK